MSRRAAARAWLAGVIMAAGGCSDRPAVTSCGEPLAGIWRLAADAGEPAPGIGPDARFHLVDDGRAIEVYALFDTARPAEGDKAGRPEVYAPVVFDLTRTGPPGAGRLTGTRSQRVTRDGETCSIRVPAEITDCRGDRLTLRYELDRGVDWARCRARQTGRWASLRLRRE